MTRFKVDIVSASEQIFSGQATFVSLPGEAGELGILPRHTPLITKIRPGLIRIVLDDGTDEHIFVAGGILEVQPDRVTVLADTAIRSQDLDEAKAREAQQQAHQALRHARSNVQYAAVQAELDAAFAQLAELSRLHRDRKKR
jgi:F-type H+-transporting ATPase subunit epsilon